MWRSAKLSNLGPPQRRALLCVLALRRRQWVPVETLVNALYDGEQPTGGVGVVQTHVSALRRVLEPNRPPRTPPTVLVSGHGGYQLRIEDEQCDLGVFERLVAEAEALREVGDWHGAQERYDTALEVFSGEALSGIPGPFAAGQRAALTERRLSLVEDGLEASVLANRSEQVIDRLRRFVAEQPLRERPPVLLMRALHARGRRSEALEVYRSTRRVLVDQLGVEPGVELRAVHGQVLAGVDSPVAPPVSPPPAGGEQTSSTPSLPMFSGRESELAVLRDYAQRAAQGTGAFVVLESYRGYGKSAVLQELHRRSPDLRVVRVGTGHAERAGQPPLLTAICDAVAEDSVRMIEHDATDTEYADALLEALAMAARERALLILVDDVFDADETSVRVLCSVAVRLHAMAVLVVAAMEDRQWEPDAAMRQAALERAANEIVRVGVLDDRSIVEIITRRLGAVPSPDLVEEICRATVAIPDLLTGLLADLRRFPDRDVLPAYLPDGAYSLAVRRQLETGTPELLATYHAIVALPPGRATLPVVAAVVGEPEAATRERCELLYTAGVLRSVDPPVFRHPLIGTMIGNVLKPRDDARILVAAARHAVLTGRPARETASYLLELEGPQYAEWVSVLIAAAEDCVARLDAADAVRHLEAARRIAVPDPHDEVLLRLGCLAQFTNPTAARLYLDEALRDQRRTGGAPTALVPLLWTMATQRHVDAAAALLAEVLAETEARDPVAAQAVHACEWVIAALRPQTWSTFVAAQREAVDDPVAAAVTILDDAFGVRIPAADALRCFSGELGLHADVLPRELTGMHAQIALWADELTLAWQLGEQRDPRLFASVDVHRAALRAEICFRRAEFDRSLLECGLLGAYDEDGAAGYPATLATYRAYALIGLGRVDEAERWIEHAAATVNPELWEWLTVNTARGVLASLRGRPRESAACFLETGRRAVAWGLDNPAFVPWRSLASGELFRLGDTGRAAELAATELELAQRWNCDRSLGIALRAVARTAPDEERVTLLESSVRHLRRSESIVDLLTALLDLARRYAARERRADARTILAEAYALAEERGAVMFLTRLDAERRTLGNESGPERSEATMRA
ncbi:MULTISPECIES: BTAD domain-containing putative transcriptional regulator [unclassified Nocardia]|uniref:BTAD domain-containing putative transcriptional regulator n=1 Tax=unclassified Nocardia TaxID=2637762 RepID=UPI0035E2488F